MILPGKMVKIDHKVFDICNEPSCRTGDTPMQKFGAFYLVVAALEFEFRANIFEKHQTDARLNYL